MWSPEKIHCDAFVMPLQGMVPHNLFEISGMRREASDTARRHFFFFVDG